MTATIQAIDTLYRGCYFRSRLEARWAIVFDILKIEWKYEPEAYRVGPDAVAYLPDFHLPDLGTWVEVKGDEQDFTTKADVYAAAVHPDSGLAGMNESVLTTRGLLILGPIPDIPPNSRRPVHTLIQHGLAWDGIEGMQRGWAGFTDDARIAIVGLDPEAATPAGLPPARTVPYSATVRYPEPCPFGSNKVAMAYAMARAARFDQGKRQLLDSMRAAANGFADDLRNSDRIPATRDVWTRHGDIETPEMPFELDLEKVRQSALRVRELAEARRAAAAEDAARAVDDAAR
jgi:hypothetical protein